MIAGDLAQQANRRRFLVGVAIGAAALASVDFTKPVTPRPWRTVLPPLRSASQPFPDLGRPRLLSRALAALDRHAARVPNRDVIGIVDFAEASKMPRFHLVDIASGRVTTHLVAHGKGSDPERSGWVRRFSNLPDSNASSRGAFLTAEAYTGKHGRSRRLVGLDSENSLAEPRGLVIHAARYVNQAMANEQGLIGRSQGCFAVADQVIGEVLERLGPGRLILAWK